MTTMDEHYEYIAAVAAERKAERKATVERLRMALHLDTWSPDVSPKEWIYAAVVNRALDAEADKPIVTNSAGCSTCIAIGELGDEEAMLAHHVKDHGVPPFLRVQR